MTADPHILVTGAAGFIGSHVAEALLERGCRVTGLDCFDNFYDPAIKRRTADMLTSGTHSDSFTLVEADIRDETAMMQLFDMSRFEGVIHLAARAGVRPSIAQPALYADVNVRGTSILLEASRASSCDRFVMASSSSVYGNNEKVPFAEADDVSRPISPYAATKRSCELIAHSHHHLTGMPTACLRFFTVFGPRQRPDLAIARFLGIVSRDEVIPMFGDGTTSRDYTYIDDIVAGVLASYDRIGDYGYRIWNLGGNHPVTLRDMIATIGGVVGREPRVEQQPMQPGDVERTYADLSRSGAELGYDPTTTFEEGVRRQWAWMAG